MRKPECQKCGNYHWGFVACKDLEKFNESTKKQPPVQWGKSMEGSRLWGDWTEDYELLGGQNLVLRKKDE